MPNEELSALTAADALRLLQGVGLARRPQEIGAAARTLARAGDVKAMRVTLAWMSISAPGWKQDELHAAPRLALWRRAAGSNQVSVLEALAADGLDPRQVVDGRTALMAAMDEGHLDALQWLLEAGVRQQQLDDMGLGLVHHGAIQGRTDMVSALVRHGHDVDLPDAQGRTALRLVAGHMADTKMFSTLLALGADPEAGVSAARSWLQAHAEAGDQQLTLAQRDFIRQSLIEIEQQRMESDTNQAGGSSRGQRL